VRMRVMMRFPATIQISFIIDGVDGYKSEYNWVLV
jgi:hypothetical protein